MPIFYCFVRKVFLWYVFVRRKIHNTSGLCNSDGVFEVKLQLHTLLRLNFQVSICTIAESDAQDMFKYRIKHRKIILAVLMFSTFVNHLKKTAEKALYHTLFMGRRE